MRAAGEPARSGATRSRRRARRPPNTTSARTHAHTRTRVAAPRGREATATPGAPARELTRLDPRRFEALAEELAGNDQTLDLARALADLAELGIAVEALHRVLAH